MIEWDIKMKIQEFLSSPDPELWDLGSAIFCAQEGRTPTDVYFMLKYLKPKASPRKISIIKNKLYECIRQAT